MCKKFKLYKKSEDQYTSDVFEILSEIDQGASSKCYRAKQANSTEGILKEFYPTESGFTLTEDENGKVLLSFTENDNREEKITNFEEAKAKYIKPYVKICTEGSPLKKILNLPCSIYYGTDDSKDRLHSVYVYSDMVVYTFREICKNLYDKEKKTPAAQRLMKILDAMISLVSRIDDLHIYGYYHCDIKPANFGFTSVGKDRVGDISLFDIDSICPTGTKNEEFKSTPGYTDPEWRDGMSEQADIYSIGAVMVYALFCADKDFNERAEDSPSKYFYKEAISDPKTKLREKVKSASLLREIGDSEELSEKISYILENSLCRRTDRYKNCEDMAADLEEAKEILQRINLGTAPAPKRRPIKAATIALIIMAAVIIVAAAIRLPSISRTMDSSLTADSPSTEDNIPEPEDQSLYSASALLKQAKLYKDGWKGHDPNTVKELESAEIIINNPSVYSTEERADAYILIGDHYYDQGDIDKSLENYSQAKILGSAEGAYKTGTVYMFDKNQPALAEENLTIAADSGHSKAMYYLFMLYEETYIGDAETQNREGRTVTVRYADGKEKNMISSKEQSQANKYLLLSAEAGYEPAMAVLAYRYENGTKGFSQDNNAALEWYMKAAEKGYPEAYTRLGIIYHKGVPFGQDYEKAAEYYKKAIEGKAASSPLASYNLGILYWNGNGVPKDRMKAMDCWTESYQGGNLNALDALFSLYQSHWNDEEKAFDTLVDASQKPELWHNAAENGEWRSVRNLGWRFFNLEIPKSRISDMPGADEDSFNNKKRELAMDCWMAAAEAGDSICMRLVGDLYGEDDIEELYGEKQLEWWKKAAEAGDSIAMRSLGEIYYGEESFEDYQKSTDEKQNYDGYVAYLTDGYYKIQLSNQESLNWYKKAAKAGDYISMARLIYYYSGKVYNIPADADQVEIWTKKLKEPAPPVNICEMLVKEYQCVVYEDQGLNLFCGPYTEDMTEEINYWNDEIEKANSK